MSNLKTSEKVKIINDSLKSCWFPYGIGCELFDIILKRKCIVVGMKSPIRIVYPDLDKTVSISRDIIHKRYINITQLTGVGNDKKNRTGTWVEKFISQSTSQ